MIKLKKLMQADGQMTKNLGFPNIKKDAENIAKTLGKNFDAKYNWNYNVDLLEHPTFIVKKQNRSFYSKFAQIGTKNSGNKSAVTYYVWKEELPNYKQLIIKTLTTLGYTVSGTKITSKEHPDVTGWIKFNQDRKQIKNKQNSAYGLKFTECYGDIVLVDSGSNK